jgi:hypothetical protein
MRLTLSWLNDRLETTASLAEIVDALTCIGPVIDKLAALA